MTKSESASNVSRFILLASICLVVGALFFAREVLIPIALAALLSFLLAPLVARLEKLKLPRTVAVIVVVLLSFGILTGIGYIVYKQSAEISQNRVAYTAGIKKKLHSFPVLNWMSRAETEFKQISKIPQTESPSTTQTAGTKNNGGQVNENADDSKPPVKVLVVNPEPASNGVSPLDLLGTVGGAILGPMGTSLIVTVFTIFMLLQREDLRDRMIRLVGRERLTTTTQALDDAARRVSRYLQMQSIVNGSVGICIAIGLWSVGKISGTPFPSPLLWGLLATLLRFIPYIGILVASVAPILLSLAVFPHVGSSVATMGVFLTIELVAANAVEPLLFGSSTGIATLAVLIAAAFWTWLWGPVGLLLSTPLTVCLVVMGKYVPQLEFLTVLLAEEPALEPPDRVYQRLMALDQEEAAELVNEYARKMPLEELFDTVLAPALAMAEQDHHRGDLDDERHSFILQGVRDIVDELGDQHRAEEIKAEAQAEVEQARGDKPTPPVKPANALAKPPDATRVLLPKGCSVNVVCLPAADEADEIAALMLGQLLEIRGYCVVVVSVTQLASEMVATAAKSRADVVCVSALPPTAVTHARYLCKRLHGQLPEIDMVVGLWGVTGDLQRAKERIACVHSVQMASLFRQAVDVVHQLVQPKLLLRNSPQNEEAPSAI
jgi:predicted PurR-regulated permease PerM/methylmalonyl-CoA mutase cobalamin-binding subunit